MQQYREQRALDAADVRYWLNVLDNLPTGTDETLRAFMKDRLVERARTDSLGLGIAWIVQSVVLDERPRPPGGLRQQLKGLRATGTKRLTRYEQPLTTSLTVPEGAVVSVALTSKAFQRGPLRAIVENVGPASIEAIKLDYYEPERRWSSQSRLTEFNPELRGDPQHGPIPPKERREILLSWERYPDGSLPRIDVGYVLFEDLTWQGASLEHAERLKSRDRRVDAADYWIATLNQLAGQPPDRARAHIAAKRTERAALDRFSSDFPVSHHLDRLIEKARTSPGEFPALVTEVVATLTRLRDHLSAQRAQ